MGCYGYSSKSYKYYENGNENIMNHSHKKKIFFKKAPRFIILHVQSVALGVGWGVTVSMVLLGLLLCEGFPQLTIVRNVLHVKIIFRIRTLAG